MMRLDKFLCDCDIASRSEVKKMIKKGLVTVNGQTAVNGKQQVDESNDQIYFCGAPLSYTPYVYYLFHKPAGCVCANHDNLHKTVFDYVPMTKKNDLFTVGRLDIDTEGLLLITNDGPLSHRLLSPGKHVSKTYLAYLDMPATPEDVSQFKEGMDIGEKHPTRPAVLQIDSKEPTQVRITIQEGMFHQVKRMVQHTGKNVLYLKRLTMGKFVLDESLSPGEYRPLNQQEMEYVREYKSGII